jgi:hypothetical protein
MSSRAAVPARNRIIRIPGIRLVTKVLARMGDDDDGIFVSRQLYRLARVIYPATTNL